MRLVAVSVVLVGFAASSSAALAQEKPVVADPMPAQGEMGLSFGFPAGGGPTFGMAYFLNPDASLRLDVGADVNGQKGASEVFWGFSVNAGYRLYIKKIDNLAPFVQPGVFVSKAADGSSFGNALTVAANGGVGAEYFFTKHFSGAGMTGVGLMFADKFKTARLTTGTTGLYVNFYW